MSQREYLLKDLTPFTVYDEYFNVILSKNQPVYITVVLDEDQKPSIYLEPFDDGAYGLCRMFFRKDDAKDFVKLVAHDKKIPIGIVRSWETSFSELSKFLIGFNDTVISQGRGGIHVVASLIHNETFRTIDTVWTTIPEFMI